MQFQLYVFFVRILIQMVYPIRIEGRSPTLDAVDAVALGQEQFRQIGPVLPGNTGNQRCLGQIFLHTCNSRSLSSESPPNKRIEVRGSSIRRHILTAVAPLCERFAPRVFFETAAPRLQ